MIYGLLNDVISDNAFVYCAIPFGHYMGDHIVSLNKHTCSVVVVLLFYVHGKHLRSCRDGQLT